jgi:hypothetical protein
MNVQVFLSPYNYAFAIQEGNSRFNGKQKEIDDFKLYVYTFTFAFLISSLVIFEEIATSNKINKTLLKRNLKRNQRHVAVD